MRINFLDSFQRRNHCSCGLKLIVSKTLPFKQTKCEDFILLLEKTLKVVVKYKKSTALEVGGVVPSDGLLYKRRGGGWTPFFFVPCHSHFFFFFKFSTLFKWRCREFSLNVLKKKRKRKKFDRSLRNFLFTLPLRSEWANMPSTQIRIKIFKQTTGWQNRFFFSLESHDFRWWDSFTKHRSSQFIYNCCWKTCFLASLNRKVGGVFSFLFIENVTCRRAPLFFVIS